MASPGGAARSRSPALPRSRSLTPPPSKARDRSLARRIELPARAHGQLSEYAVKYGMPKRPGYNQSGKEVMVGLNSFDVKQLPTVKVYQYDVRIGQHEKRGLMRAVWESETTQRNLGPGWLFDGNRLAWSATGVAAQKNVAMERQSYTFQVDMDKERGDTGIVSRNARIGKGDKNPQEERLNIFTVTVRCANAVNLSVLDHYLAGKMDFSDAVLQAINFLNHLMRHTPSKSLVTIKNSFFPNNWPDPYDLGAGVYAIRGIFQSIRLASGHRMIVNVDVANATFWAPGRMDYLAVALAEAPRKEAIIQYVQKHQKNPPIGPYKDTPLMEKLRRMKKIAFTVNYHNMPERLKKRRFIVKDIMYTNAWNTFFDYTNPETGEKKRLCVREYFDKVYGHPLSSPDLPLVEATKRGVFYPMEFCHVEIGQRNPYKLTEAQTSEMIKFAVARPDARMSSIQAGLGALNWRNDPMLKNYGLQISDRMIESKARLLTAPKVQFAGNASESPGVAGRWRIDKKRFYRVNKKPLKYWACCVIHGKGRNVGEQETLSFLREFINHYKQYGAEIERASPIICKGNDEHTEKAVDGVVDQAERAWGKGVLPQFCIFILPRKETFLYNQLKRHCDIKYGFLSQMVQAAHVLRNNPQYHGNVLMKVNAKLGGQSFKAVPLAGPVAKRNGAYFAKPTMIIGADVSHPSPGMIKPSFAAVTVSLDKDAIRYGSCVQSNGHRIELITPWNLEDMLGPLIREWVVSLGQGRLPEHVIYFRDGVSEGEFQAIIQKELTDIRAIFNDIDGDPKKQNAQKIKFTAIVASKRHHIRFFPKPGPAADRNKNPHPGVIVERDVTGPFEFDFYLCSHSAIQGTARPTHYTVILDQEGMDPTFLQNMIYEHCYQYIRSSTPVSVHPAIYYAHLASRRAAAHETTQEGHLIKHRSSEQREREMLIAAKAEAEETGKVMTDAAQKRLKYYMQEEYPPLQKTANEQLWREMWYI